MPEAGQIVGPLIAGLLALIAWRYVQPLLEWLEQRAAKGASRLAARTRQGLASQWAALLPLTLMVVAATLMSWFVHYLSGPLFLLGALSGFAAGGAERRGWIPRGLTPALAGPPLAAVGLIGVVYFAVVMKPVLALVGLSAVVLGVIVAAIGIGMLRRREDSPRSGRSAGS